MRQSVIVIGAGVAGLAAATYLQKSGYETRVLEMHDKPGGSCTAWRRKGYTFDFCIHNLLGSTPRSVFRPLWEELGALDGLETKPFEEFIRVEDSSGRYFALYADPGRLEKHMKELSPGDAGLVDDFVRAVRRFARVGMGAMTPTPATMLRSLRYVPDINHWSKVTLEEFGRRLSDPLLRRAFPHLQYNMAGMPIPTLILLLFLGTLTTGDLGWPVGGSLAFSAAIERHYRALGGETRYRAKVERVLVEGGSGGGEDGGGGRGQGRDATERAVGVRLASGEELRADIVISAADGYDTIYRMLGGRYAQDLAREYFSAEPRTQPFTLTVGLGVARPFPAEPHNLVLLLDEPVTIAGEPRDSLYAEFFAFDSTMAPPGKTAVKIAFDSSYAYWHPLREQGDAYEREEKAVADQVIAILDRRFPGFAADVEVIDVATPVTVERFTNCYHGLQAWPGPWPMKGFSPRGLGQTVPGLDNFYMVGQWTKPINGLPVAASTGRDVARRICREDGRPFRK